MKVLITSNSFGKFDSKPRELMESLGWEVVGNRYHHIMNEEEMMGEVPGVDAIILGSDTVSKKVLEKADKLKIISRYGVGIDNIDLEEAKKRNIIVSYDSNYRAKLWSLDEASKFMKEVLPFVDIAFLGILDFINILEYKPKEEDYEAKLADFYKELFENYSNLKYMASTKRTVNSANNNSLQGFLFNGEKLEKSKVYTFDILDRVGGGDSFTAGVLHGLISDMKCSDAIEFATCASVLKHSIIGDINMVDEKDVTTLMKNGVGNINR